MTLDEVRELKRILQAMTSHERLSLIRDAQLIEATASAALAASGDEDSTGSVREYVPFPRDSTDEWEERTDGEGASHHE